MPIVTFTEAIETVKTSLDILAVVSSVVSLKKNGRNYTGLCPFHKEKTPSFTVHREKNLFKCFGCGEAGDTITFLMKQSGKPFADIIMEQAELLGLDIQRDPNQPAGPSRQQRDNLADLNQVTAQWFEQQLSGPILDYLNSRGYSREAVKPFGVGFAPKQWDALRQHLLLNFPALTDAQLELAGLVVLRQEGGGAYDRFRNRLIIPIHDEQGKVVAFGARALDANDMPKYLNSPETAVYHKSRILYGLNRAKAAIKERHRALVMEGYFDVIRAQSAGFWESVATCGTALTREHCQLLTRAGVQTLYLCFDSDAAGQKATISALDLIDQLPGMQGPETLRVKVIQLPDGKDPDDYIARHGAEAFETVLLHAQPHWQYRCESALSGFNLEVMDDRVAATNQLVTVLKRIQHPVLRSEYVRQYASRLHVTPEDLLTYVNPDLQRRAISRRPRTSIQQQVKRDTLPVLRQQLAPRHQLAEREILTMIFIDESTYQQLRPQLTSVAWVSDAARRLSEAILFLPDELDRPQAMSRLHRELSAQPEMNQFYTTVLMSLPDEPEIMAADDLHKRFSQLQSILNGYHRQVRLSQLATEIRHLEATTTDSRMEGPPSDETQWHLVDLQYQLRDGLETTKP